MPRLATFYGIVVAMYFDDHPPPHVHARYGEFEAQVDTSTGDVLNGYLPRRAAGLVREWVGLHRDELDANWSRARAGEPLSSIEPLP